MGMVIVRGLGGAMISPNTFKYKIIYLLWKISHGDFFI
jgi:hypothetical protein